MSFAVIDMDGSTVETFDDAESMLAFLVRLRQQSPVEIDDLGVVEYQAGRRVGPPMLASGLVEQSDFSRIQAAVALVHSDISIENIPFDAALTEPVLIDIAMSTKDTEAEALEAIQRADSHRFPLAA
jgi:hypothetical protein